MATAEAILSAVRLKGSDARDLRDAAHEACHALMWGVKKSWTRDNIHAKKPRARSLGVSDEITARAVEQVVCRRLGVDCGTVEQWAMVCCMEMLKNERISLPFDWLLRAINERIDSRSASEMADAVIALSAEGRP